MGQGRRVEGRGNNESKGGVVGTRIHCQNKPFLKLEEKLEPLHSVSNCILQPSMGLTIDLLPRSPSQ